MKRRHLLSIVGAACLVATSCLSASKRATPSLEAEYISMRDAAVATVRRRDAAGGPITAAQAKTDEATIAALEGKLRQIVGPAAFDGFSKQGKDNADTLSTGDVGFGALDALRFEGGTPRTMLFVTSEGLLETWLKAHRDWWKEEQLPQEVSAALRRPAFYTQAISADAAVFLYAELPVTTPLGAKLVTAQLAADSQADVPPLPDQLIVTIIKDDRVAIVVMPLATAFGSPPTCKHLNKRGAKDDADVADDAALRCFSQHASETPTFRAATHQAQTLVDRLAK